MGFKFSFLVELLEDLERNRFRKASNASKSVNPDHAIIIQWFNKYDAKIKRSQTEGLAFLSCLFPERRPDRSFHMQETRLASLFGRIYQLGTARLNELRAWKERKPADFPTCLASVLAQTEMPVTRPGNEVTLEEIDNALDNIAANVKASGPALEARATVSDKSEILTPILYRLQSTEAKWLVRMLLKSYHPVQIPEAVSMQQFHFLLPDLLAVQNDFGAAMATLNQEELVRLPKRVSEADAIVLKTQLADHLIPKIGVMVKRQAYHKARSIRDCCQMADGKLMSIEQKYDGEYCQIHIDMSKHPSKQIQIFSKSGRDSTQDRIRLHNAIEESLGLQSRSQQCKVKSSCILEGELLIYSRSTGTIQPFHKIRKHVQHGGRFLNHEADSPVALNEQVMIMYYDILLLDRVNLMVRPQEERRRCLEYLIAPTNGLAEIGVRRIFDFRSSKAPQRLREIFASCITQRLEGFVVKPCNEPYVSSTSSNNGIKLKKDYMTELGDIADVALVGARLDPKAQRNLGHADLKWNSFFMGCLVNKDEIVRFDSKPSFRVIGEVTFMPTHDMEYLNTQGETLATPVSQSNDYMDISIGIKQAKTPEVLFKTPFIVEVLGSGFERAPNATYWTLRHPRLHKLHGDRSVTETASFDELQEMANTAQTAPINAISQSDRDWIEKLQRADPKSIQTSDISPSTTNTSERSPGSVTTASPLEIRITPKSASFSIWNDASRSLEVTNKFSKRKRSSPAGSETRSAIYRRCKENAVMLQTQKREQATPCKVPDSTKGAKFISPPPARDTISIRVDGNRASKRTCIKKTPPWCRPCSSAGSAEESPFEPPAVFRTFPSKLPSRLNSNQGGKSNVSGSSELAREPLAEVATSSMAHNALSACGLLEDLRKSKQRENSASAMRLADAKTSMLARPTPHPLPTPPSSAEEIAKLQRAARPEMKHGSYSSKSAGTGHRLPTEPSNPPGVAQRCFTTASLSTTPSRPPPRPLLLTSLLQPLQPDTRNALVKALRLADLTSTTSILQYVIQIPSQAVAFALVDITAAPTKIAKVIRNVMDRLRLLALDAQENVRQSGCVVFLDWRCLETFEMESGQDLRHSLGGSRRHFAGCLKWALNYDETTTRTSLTVTECFDWNDAVLYCKGLE